jgi:hypothetical protein
MWLWLMQLVIDLSLLMPGFSPRVIHVGFVVDIVLLGHGFRRALQFSLAGYHSTNVLYLYLIRGWYSRGLLEAAVPPRASLTAS